jgi:hypothetical protein
MRLFHPELVPARSTPGPSHLVLVRSQWAGVDRA